MKVRAYWLYLACVAGMLTGSGATALAFEHHAEWARSTAPVPADCVERMNAAARKCDEGGLVEFTQRVQGDYDGPKGIMCIRSTREELRP